MKRNFFLIGPGVQDGWDVPGWVLGKLRLRRHIPVPIMVGVVPASGGWHGRDAMPAASPPPKPSTAPIAYSRIP
jgi:hypothetical protein